MHIIKYNRYIKITYHNPENKEVIIRRFHIACQTTLYSNRKADKIIYRNVYRNQIHI